MFVVVVIAVAVHQACPICVAVVLFLIFIWSCIIFVDVVMARCLSACPGIFVVVVVLLLLFMRLVPPRFLFVVVVSYRNSVCHFKDCGAYSQ